MHSTGGASRDKSSENLKESKSSQKLHKVSSNKKIIQILEKQTKEIDELTLKLSNRMSKLTKAPDEEIVLTEKPLR